MIFGFCAIRDSAMSRGRWLMSNSRSAARDLSSPRLARRYRRPNEAWAYLALRVVKTMSGMERRLYDRPAGLARKSRVRSGDCIVIGMNPPDGNHIWAQVAWLLILAIPISCVAWTVTHEEVFREPR